MNYYKLERICNVVVSQFVNNLLQIGTIFKNRNATHRFEHGAKPSRALSGHKGS